jgi:hypothetical protein
MQMMMMRVTRHTITTRLLEAVQCMPTAAVQPFNREQL